MPWTKTAWSDLIGSDATKVTLSAGSTTTGTLDCAAANDYITLGLKVLVVFGTTPDDDVTVDVYGLDTDSGADTDTIPIRTGSIPEVSTSTEVVTYQIPVSALDHVKVKITNNDSADTVDVWVNWMAGYW